MLTLPDTYSQPSAIGAENAIQLQNTQPLFMIYVVASSHTLARAHTDTQTHAHRHTDTHTHTHTHSQPEALSLSLTWILTLILISTSCTVLYPHSCRLRPVEQSMALDSPLELSGGQWDLSWPPWCLLGVRSTVSAHRNIYIHYKGCNR